MHRALSRFSSQLISSLTALSLCLAVPTLAGAAGKTTFLGVEGEGSEAEALGKALGAELEKRGRGDGRNMSLAELEMTMGCGDDDVGCYAQGGETLGSEELVYASMAKSGAGWTVKLTSVDVAKRSVGKSVSQDVSDADLAKGAIAKTAASLLDALYSVEAAVVDPPGDDTPPGDDPELDDNGHKVPPPPPDPDHADDEGKLIWGRYSPRPKWKPAMLGVSAGLTVVSLGAAIGTTIAIGPNGPIRKDLLAAAADSLTDDKPSNDVDPASDQDLCELARTPPDPDRPEEVTNADVTRVCIKADNTAKGATISWIATGVFGVTTIVFTVLMFVHKDKSGVAAMRKRDVRFGAAPMGVGGFVVGGGMRF